jgi:hypothetical protein
MPNDGRVGGRVDHRFAIAHKALAEGGEDTKHNGSRDFAELLHQFHEEREKGDRSEWH